MSEPTAQAKSNSPIVMFLKWQQANSQATLHTFFTGRIDRVEARTTPEGKRVFEHDVTCPTSDGYSSPNRIQVQHTSRMGSAGDEVTGVLKGQFWFGPAQRSRPNDDGEVRNWRPARYGFHLVELF